MHDSGNRYSSKIYNDEWMNTKGYLDSSFNVLISEVLKDLKKEDKPLIKLEDNANIGDAIKLMEEKGISQLPVFGKGILKGMVSEDSLVKPVFRGVLQLNESISLAYHNKFHMIDENVLLDNVINNLLKKEVVLVTKKGVPFTILTDIDILNYMAEKGRA
jgi:cystathionine beta-synthase